ncbi:MAG TPA: ASCH domain-containing protein [Azospirillaceae bacterium]|nr:ASCH domain-containing protein [Azospirillaceae bacterium]
MKALSIRQPWCHHILYDGKDVENRSWSTSFRGKVLIHASKTPENADFCLKRNLPLGGIVGIMEIIDCVTAMDSDWFCGPYGFVIGRSRPLPFVPCGGRLGFFDVSGDVVQTVRRLAAGSSTAGP